MLLFNWVPWSIQNVSPCQGEPLYFSFLSPMSTVMIPKLCFMERKENRWQELSFNNILWITYVKKFNSYLKLLCHGREFQEVTNVITLCAAANKWASFINFPGSCTMSIGLNWSKLFMYYYPTNSSVFMVLFWPLLIISYCNELVFDEGFCSLSMSWVIIEVSSILRKSFWLNKHGRYESMNVQVCSITSRHFSFPTSFSTPSCVW